MKLGKLFKTFLTFLSQRQVPLWLVLIITFSTLAISKLVDEHFETKERQESIRRESVSQIVDYSNAVDLLSSSIFQFRVDMES